jgi:hypothetical protein
VQQGDPRTFWRESFLKAFSKTTKPPRCGGGFRTTRRLVNHKELLLKISAVKIAHSQLKAISHFKNKK